MEDSNPFIREVDFAIRGGGSITMVWRITPTDIAVWLLGNPKIGVKAWTMRDDEILKILHQRLFFIHFQSFDLSWMKKHHFNFIRQEAKEIFDELKASTAKLSSLQKEILCWLSKPVQNKHGETPLKWSSKHFKSKPDAVSNALKSLEDRGFIERELNKDKQTEFVKLTEFGCEALYLFSEQILSKSNGRGIYL